MKEEEASACERKWKREQNMCMKNMQEPAMGRMYSSFQPYVKLKSFQSCYVLYIRHSMVGTHIIICALYTCIPM